MDISSKYRFFFSSFPLLLLLLITSAIVNEQISSAPSSSHSFRSCQKSDPDNEVLLCRLAMALPHIKGLHVETAPLKNNSFLSSKAIFPLLLKKKQQEEMNLADSNCREYEPKDRRRSPIYYKSMTLYVQGYS